MGNTIIFHEIPDKLKIKSRKLPEVSDKALDTILNNIMQKIEGLNHKQNTKRNLTHREVAGMKWCKKVVKERRLYITKADKGGAILILDAEIVQKIVLETLQNEDKYTKLNKDPRDNIKKELKKMVNKYNGEGLLANEVKFAITGQTEKGGFSHNHEFCVSAPYIYPLFKIHKLTEKMIKDKTIPPTRMVTSGIGGPTYRLGVFLNYVLKPIVEDYCKGELLRDTTDFVCEIDKMNKSGAFRTCCAIGTLDVDALYPNIKRKLALKAVRHALDKKSTYNSQAIDMIIELLKFCLNNSIIQFRDLWFRSEDGVPTGGTESGSIANIFVKWILDEVLLKDSDIAKLNKMDFRKRFLDDIWFCWNGTQRQFQNFKNALNLKGSNLSFTLKGQTGKRVEFLDTETELKNGKIVMKTYFKPTDAKRYLNRKSDHPGHMFNSIPFSQFRRVIITCSDNTHRSEAINHISTKLHESGYKPNEINKAKLNALKINRNKIIESRLSEGTEKIVKIDENETRILTFVMNHDAIIKTEIKKILHDNEEGISKAIGKNRIIIAEKRNMNTASMLFQKAGFSKTKVLPKTDQKCKQKNCKCCTLMNLGQKLVLKETTLRLDYTLNCKSNNVIYGAKCKHCDINEGLYIGQTVNSVSKRMCGHRSHFDIRNDNYKKSALSFHIFEKHENFFEQGLANYDIGVIRSSAPMKLDLLEDIYVRKTKAETRGLNRYKVLK